MLKAVLMPHLLPQIPSPLNHYIYANLCEIYPFVQDFFAVPHCWSQAIKTFLQNETAILSNILHTGRTLHINFFKFSVQECCFDIYFFSQKTELNHNEKEYSGCVAFHIQQVVLEEIYFRLLTVPVGYQPIMVCSVRFNYEYPFAFNTSIISDIRDLVVFCHTFSYS